MFRIQSLDAERGHVRVHPVAAIGKDGPSSARPPKESPDARGNNAAPSVPL